MLKNKTNLEAGQLEEKEIATLKNLRNIITLEEIQKAVKYLKNKKDTGLDGIKN